MNDTLLVRRSRATFVSVTHVGPTCLCAKYTWELPMGSTNSTKTQVAPISSGKNEHLTTQAMQVCTH